MNNLYKENSILLNNEIAREQKNYIKYGKYADICRIAFKFFAGAHILIAGLYGISALVSSILFSTVLPFISPVLAGLVISCVASVGTTSILGMLFDKKQGESSKRFDSLCNMKREYERKPVTKESRKGKMICKEIITDYNYSKDKDMSLTLKK